MNNIFLRDNADLGAGRIITLDEGTQWRRRISHMRERIFQWCELVQGQPIKTIMWMYMFSYGPGEKYQPRDITNCIARMHRHYGKNLLAIAWTAELQKPDTDREHLHYHLLIVLRAGTWVQHPDTMGWWEKGSTHSEEAKKPYYIAKYVSKGCILDGRGSLPKGARLFAVWIADELIASSYMGEDMAHYKLKITAVPHWLRDIVEKHFPGCLPRKKNHGWIIEEEGIFIESRYTRISEWEAHPNNNPMRDYVIKDWKA
jgi:hypothetical protein